MEQNVYFFKSLTRYSITYGSLSICWSVHLLVRPFISPSVALLVGFTFFFFAFTSDFNVTSPTQMFSSKFPHCPCPPQHNIGSLPSSFVFCRARCFAVRLSKIVRREPGWLCKKNHLLPLGLVNWGTLGYLVHWNFRKKRRQNILLC